MGAFDLPILVILNNYLFLGYYLRKYDINNKRIIYILGIISLFLMPVFDSFIINNNSRNDVVLNATSIFPIFLTLSIYYLIKDNYKKIKITKYIKKQIVKVSNLSLYIYLFHVLVLNILVKLLNKIWIQDRLYENILLFIILLIFTFIFSYLISIIFDYVYNKIRDKIKTINFTNK